MAVTLKASKIGLEKVELARKEKGWSAQEPRWWMEANSSESTLKRFRQGISIDRDTFIALCKVVEVNWKEIVDSSFLKESEFAQADKADFSSILDREKYYNKFIGRQSELEEIYQYLESKEPHKIVSIVGIGGLGKTALTHQIALRTYQAKLFNKIIWIRAKIYQYQTESLGTRKSLRESRLTIEDALKEMGNQLKLAPYLFENKDILKEEISKVLHTIPHLLIIDGLEDTVSPSKLAGEFRNCLGKSCLLLTSRQLTNNEIKVYKLSKFDRTTSEEFIKTIAEEKYFYSQNPIKKASKEQIDSILKITDGMALAMKLLVSQAKILPLDRIIQRLKNISEEQNLYNYLFEDSWLQLQQEKAINTQKLLVYLGFAEKM